MAQAFLPVQHSQECLCHLLSWRPGTDRNVCATATPGGTDIPVCATSYINGHIIMATVNPALQTRNLTEAHRQVRSPLEKLRGYIRTYVSLEGAAVLPVAS